MPKILINRFKKDGPAYFAVIELNVYLYQIYTSS